MSGAKMCPITKVSYYCAREECAWWVPKRVDGIDASGCVVLKIQEGLFSNYKPDKINCEETSMDDVEFQPKFEKEWAKSGGGGSADSFPGDRIGVTEDTWSESCRECDGDIGDIGMNDLKITWLLCEQRPEYIVGEEDVVKIEEHASQGDGDRWFYDVIFGSGKKIVREFYPSTVIRGE